LRRLLGDLDFDHLLSPWRAIMRGKAALREFVAGG